MQVGVCTHDTLDKVLTEPVSPLRVDPTFDRPVMITCRRRTGRTVCAKNPDHDRSYHCGACDYHGIDTDKFRNTTNYQVHRKIIKWFTQECVPPYGSDWTPCETTRESLHLWLEPSTPSCESMNCKTSQLFHGSSNCSEVLLIVRLPVYLNCMGIESHGRYECTPFISHTIHLYSIESQHTLAPS